MPRWFVILLACLGVSGLSAWAAGPQARIELTDGAEAEGTLLAIDADGVRLQTVTGEKTLPLAGVRRVVLAAAEGAKPPLAAVTVTTTTGSRITGDDFAWTGDVATVIRGADRLELPSDGVLMVAWRRPEDAAGDPAWLATLPDQPESDLVVVGAGPDVECVACAITAVSAETVTVVLEGETIPVKRTRVAGLRWMRPPATAPGRIEVVTAAGRFDAGRVTWSPIEGLLLDGRVRMPAAWLTGIDYAAGRTVWLTTIETERQEVDPFFAGLRGVEGLTGFFTPRVVTPRAPGAASLLLRPRTVSVWRVPADSRRFFGTLRPASEAAPRAAVVIDLDGREVFRGGFTADEPPADQSIDLDVAGARRLTLTVDFAAGGPGGPVRLDDARFEK